MNKKFEHKLQLLCLIILSISTIFLIYSMYVFDFVLMWIVFYIFGMTYTFSILIKYGDDVKNKLKYAIIFSLIFPITWILRLLFIGNKKIYKE